LKNLFPEPGADNDIPDSQNTYYFAVTTCGSENPPLTAGIQNATKIFETQTGNTRRFGFQ
jgi:hypothetical protein